MSENSDDPEDIRRAPQSQKEKRVDPVVEELRQVLSRLDQSASSLPHDSTASHDLVSERLSEFAPEEKFPSGPLPDNPPEPLNPDADFWNGNVLGWPSAPAS